MPLSLRWGHVTAIRERLDGLVRLDVDGNACIAYPRLTGPVEEGDTVLVNTQARDLGLDAGDFDVLYANLTRGLGLEATEAARVLSLPYTPGQVALRRGEDDEPGDGVLDGLPVICCSVHSQVAPVCAALRGLRVAYVQLGGGALPVSYSDTVRLLRIRQLIERSVAVAPCLDAEVECVSTASALLWAARRSFDAVVCSIGPGLVGTGTTFGHGALAAAEAANAASALGGQPIVVARVSNRDERDRHRGVSHHTRAVLRLCLGNVRIAWPSDLVGGEWDPAIVQVDVADWQRACEGVPLAHHGRGPEDDPWFFAAAFAAGRLAAQLRAETLSSG